jgi:methylmalonyl-CoA epimerase
VLDACGYDVIIIETVGVGQGEVEIINHADLVMVLAVPGLGDDIQAIKAGLLEIGDIFVVNKSDLPGADRVAVELRAGISLSAGEKYEQIPIIMVSAETGMGLDKLLDSIDNVFEKLNDSGEILLRRALRLSGGSRLGLQVNKGESKMKCLHFDHIGVAVKNLEDAAKFYEAVLGIKPTGIEEVEEQKVKVMFMPCGDCEFELLESTSPDGPVARFIEKYGEGVQHIAIRVDDIDAALAELKEKGIRLIDETPRYGAGGARIIFIHPKATNGVLLELCERK